MSIYYADSILNNFPYTFYLNISFWSMYFWKNEWTHAFSFFQQNQEDGIKIGIMRLMKNGVVMSYSRGLGFEENLFGTAILNLVAGDEVHKSF